MTHLSRVILLPAITSHNIAYVKYSVAAAHNDDRLDAAMRWCERRSDGRRGLAATHKAEGVGDGA